MSLREQLRQYSYWLTKSPGQILAEVPQAGGWSVVFSDELPKWAHRVRNFFNREPTQLTYHKFNIAETDVYRLFNMQIGLDAKKDLALSGHSYLDEGNNVWLQMAPAATVYHFRHNLPTQAMAAVAAARGQNATPVFKLFYIDGTNGSSETIIKNPQKKDIRLQLIAGVAVSGTGKSRIEGGIIRNQIVKDPEYQGSYNYGETVAVGSAWHTKFDVTPHKEDPQGYKNPLDRFSDLFSRKFPDRDNDGNLLADLKW